MSFNLREWQARHMYTYDTAAQALGIGRTTYYDYLKKPDLPKWLVLACKAIDAGIEAHDSGNLGLGQCPSSFGEKKRRQ